MTIIHYIVLNNTTFFFCVVLQSSVTETLIFCKDNCSILLFIVLFAKNCTNQIKSKYLNSHGEEAQEKPPGL